MAAILQAPTPLPLPAQEDLLVQTSLQAVPRYSVRVRPTLLAAATFAPRDHSRRRPDTQLIAREP